MNKKISLLLFLSVCFFAKAKQIASIKGFNGGGWFHDETLQNAYFGNHEVIVAIFAENHTNHIKRWRNTNAKHIR